MKWVFALSLLCGVSYAVLATPISDSGVVLSGTWNGNNSDTTARSVASSAATDKPAVGRERLGNAEKRKLKNEEFAARLDSLLRSKHYVFFPNSMQQLPNGIFQLIYNQAYYVGIYDNCVEMHLPVVAGRDRFVGIVNFDTFEIRDYRIATVPSGWNVAFEVVSGGSEVYVVNISVVSTTGEVTLDLSTSDSAMRYVGFIESAGNYRPDVGK